jgi:hypothetical protein
LHRLQSFLQHHQQLQFQRPLPRQALSNHKSTTMKSMKPSLYDIFFPCSEVFFWALFAFWKWVSTIMDFGYSLFLINEKRLHKGLACCSKEVCLILFVVIFGFETGGGSGQPATSRP